MARTKPSAVGTPDFIMKSVLLFQKAKSCERYIRRVSCDKESRGGSTERVRTRPALVAPVAYHRRDEGRED